MEALTARLNEQAAQIQKVSAQLEASKPAPQWSTIRKKPARVWGSVVNCFDNLARFLPNSASLKLDLESGGRTLPARFFAFFQTRNRRINLAGKRREYP